MAKPMSFRSEKTHKIEDQSGVKSYPKKQETRTVPARLELFGLWQSPESWFPLALVVHAGRILVNSKNGAEVSIDDLEEFCRKYREFQERGEWG
jgi:hypothetical protein